MKKLMNAINNLRRNRKKGFTLVELIVVIIIIAILIAALTPAVLGVVDRAKQSSDEVEARSVMMAASVWALSYKTPPTSISPSDVVDIIAEIQGGGAISTSNIKKLYFDGFICTQVDYIRQAKTIVSVGTNANVSTLVYTAV